MRFNSYRRPSQGCTTGCGIVIETPGGRSRGRFATPADAPLEECSPYSHEHVRRESLGVVHRSSAIFCRPAPNLRRYAIRNCVLAVQRCTGSTFAGLSVTSPAKLTGSWVVRGAAALCDSGCVVNLPSRGHMNATLGPCGRCDRSAGRVAVDVCVAPSKGAKHTSSRVWSFTSYTLESVPHVAY
jgi:hypothetical protein